MTVPFWTSFALTLALLGAAVFTGARRRRRPHVCLAVAALAALAVTVWLTEQLASALEFPETELRVHLFFAQAGAVLVLPVVLTGVLAWRPSGRRRCRRLHLACVVTFLLAAVTATGTGVFAFSLATPR